MANALGRANVADEACAGWVISKSCDGIGATMSTENVWRKARWTNAARGKLGTADKQARPVGPRKALLVNATHCFNVDWLLHEGGGDLLLERHVCLRRLYDAFAPILFAQSRETCPYANSPGELFDRIPFDSFWQQYISFCRLVQRVAKTEKGSLIYDRLAAEVEFEGRTLRVPVAAINWKSHQFTTDISGAALETIVLRRRGRVRIIRWVTKARDYRLHGILSDLKYEIIRKFGVWHVFRLYHRLLIWSWENEAIAESVASVVRFIEKKHGTGRHPPLVHSAAGRVGGPVKHRARTGPNGTHGTKWNTRNPRAYSTDHGIQRGPRNPTNPKGAEPTGPTDPKELKAPLRSPKRAESHGTHTTHGTHRNCRAHGPTEPIEFKGHKAHAHGTHGTHGTEPTEPTEPTGVGSGPW